MGRKCCRNSHIEITHRREEERRQCGGDRQEFSDERLVPEIGAARGEEAPLAVKR